MRPSDVAKCPTRARAMRRRSPASITAMSRLAVPIFLRETDVKELLTMDVTLAALEAAFREWAAGRASNQPRRRVAAGAVLATMSAALPSKGLMGFKAYTHGKSGARFWLCLFDAADGRPHAVIEADWLGRMRTGATSGLATKYLARHNATIVGLIGSGNQAVTQLMGVCAVRPISIIYVYSRNAQVCKVFCDEIDKILNIEVRPVTSARQAVDVG